MTKLGIFGANGRMGKVLIEAIANTDNADLSLASVREGSPWAGLDVGELSGIGKLGLLTEDDVSNNIDSVDVMIDFTLPAILNEHLELCIRHNKPLVVGTTGLTDEQKQTIKHAAKSIPVVFSANMSIGVNLLFNLLKQTARVMGETSDIEIWEAHHRFKRDAPSGTAVAMGEVIAEEMGQSLSDCAVYTREGDTGERVKGSIGFATVRAGDIVGEHTAMFADIGERIEITHKASSRLTFAKGAVKAAVWLKDKKTGLYDMQDVLGLS